MKKLLPLLLAIISVLTAWAQGPCTTTNATGCQCATPGQTNCDLLPDITISWQDLTNYTEYPQTGAGTNYNGQGPDDGRLRLTGTTPNIGFGSFTVRGTDWYVCGTDTFQSTQNPGLCPDGTFPQNLLEQRVYHKNGATMTSWDRYAGSMTFHPTHNHNHVDNWTDFSLRIKQPAEPDPRKWPIVGSGSKIGFCLMDFGTCTGYNGRCRDVNTVYQQGNVLLNGDFPNYGLGGGQYSCSPVEQGISSGYVDVYGKHLDMMWINIPPNICNGEYWVVAIVDPKNFFLEADESNNYTAIPITLTQQSPANTNPWATITANKPGNICQGDSVQLHANGALHYTWSTGDTTQTIWVKQSGSYTVTLSNYCGTATSTAFAVNVGNAGDAPALIGDTLCTAGTATLSGPNNATIQWFADAQGTTLLGEGNTFIATNVSTDSIFYGREVSQLPPSIYNVGPTSDVGGGNYTSNNQYMIFDALTPFTLKSVLLDADQAGTRRIYLRNFSNVVLDSVDVTIPVGITRTTLNFNVPAGSDYRLTVGSNPRLFRNSGGVQYPYVIDNVVSIKNSSADNQYYYYFYDWEVETASNACYTALAPVQVLVNSNLTTTITPINSEYNASANPVQLSATPAGGTFSGQGVVGNTFDPGLAGPGGPYEIVYTYTSNGCTVTDTIAVSVKDDVGVNDIVDFKQPISLYPNPANGQVNLTFELKTRQDVDVAILDLAGRTVYIQTLKNADGKQKQTLSTQNLASGVYTLTLKVNNKISRRKMVVN